MHPKTKNLIQLNAAVVLWGMTAQFAKLIDLPAIQIIFGRNVVAVVALCIFGLAVRDSVRIRSRRDALAMLFIGTCMCIHWVTYFQSIQASTVAIGLVALHVYPVMVALCEPWFFRERLHPVDAILAIIVFVGVLVLVPEFSLANEMTYGIVLGVISACFLSARNIMTRKYVARYTPTTLMFYQSAITVVLLIPLGSPMAMTEQMPVSLYQIGQLVVLGIFLTALPHTLYTCSFVSLKAKTVAIVGSLLPVYGLLFAIPILGEIPSTRTILGGTIVLSAAVIEAVRSVR